MNVTAHRPSAGKHVALLQGNPSEAELLRDWLVMAGHLCSLHACGHAFMRAARRLSFDIVVLDWNMRNVTGEVVLKHLRATLQSQVPIIFVSALNEEAAVVAAFRGGADDYIVKPVRRLELLARLEALSRRSRPEMSNVSAVIDHGSLQVDCHGRIARRDGKPITLTAKDFDLAVLFLSNVGRLLSRNQIHDAIWGAGAAFDSRTLDTHASRVRIRLGLTPPYGWRLAAVYGYGYRLDQVPIPPTDKAPMREQPSRDHSLNSSAA